MSRLTRSAAVGSSWRTPEEMLAEITRHSRFTIEEFQALATEQPVDRALAGLF